MSNFYDALNNVLIHEGGFVNHAADKGGATAYGISIRFLSGLPKLAGDVNGDGHVDILDIQSLTEQSAAEFYKKYFWDHYRLGEIRDQRVAQKLFNFFVNMRGKTAGLIGQRAANDLGAGLVEDGIDLLVMVPRKKSFFEKVFGGSDTKEMAYLAAIPVLSISE